MSMKRSTISISSAIAICALVVGVIVTMIVTYRPLETNRKPFMYSRDVIPLYPDHTAAFQFNPKADITPYELAIVMMAFNGTNQSYERMRPLYDQMPPEVKRHWIELKKPAEPGPQVPELKK